MRVTRVHLVVAISFPVNINLAENSMRKVKVDVPRKELKYRQQVYTACETGSRYCLRHNVIYVRSN